MGKLLTISDGDYHAIDAVSNTTLSNLKISPWHAKYWRKDETNAMKLGTLIHAAVLEPRLFKSRFILMPEFIAPTADGTPSSRSKKALQAKADWLANQDPDAVILTTDEMAIIEGIQASLKEHPRFMDLVMGCMAEITGVWERDGLVCKAKADLINPKAGVLIDLKSTKDASESEFARSIYNRGYDRQLAWYRDGFQRATGSSINEVYILAVEKEVQANERVRVELYEVSSTILIGGKRRSDELFEEYKTWHKKNEWPLSLTSKEVKVINYPSFVREEFLGDENE